MQLQYVLHMGHLNVDYSLSHTHMYTCINETDTSVDLRFVICNRKAYICYETGEKETEVAPWIHGVFHCIFTFSYGCWCTHLICFALVIHNIEWHRTIATGKCVHAFLTSLQLCENKLNMDICIQFVSY